MFLEEKLRELISKAKKLAVPMDERNEMNAKLIELAEEAKLLNPEVDELPEFCDKVRQVARANQAFALSIVANAMVSFASQLCQLDMPSGLKAFALTEPSSGSDLKNISTTFNGKVRGVKTLVTNAELAEVFAVLAREESGYTLCFVSGKDAEIRKLNVSAFRGSGISAVKFDANVICKVDDGLKIALQTLNYSRPAFSAIALGISEECLNRALKYAYKRKAFGKSVLDFQSVSFALAECCAEVEALRAVVEKASRKPDAYNSAVCKLLAAKTVKKVTDCAMQVLAGHGLVRGGYVERAYRDAKAFDVGEGTSEMMKLAISKLMRKGYISGR